MAVETAETKREQAVKPEPLNKYLTIREGINKRYIIFPGERKAVMA